MIRAVIFDCFGVIISDALSVIVDELRSRDPEAAEQVSDLVRASNRGLIDPQDSNQQIATILNMELEAYRRAIRDGEVKDHRVLDYARELRQHYKVGMLSNINLPGLQRRFPAEEIASCFDVVVASGDIGYAKPDAEAYRITAERLGVEPTECVFTDDRSDFCDAARAVGMQAVWFQSFEQAKADIDTLLVNAA